MTQQDQLDELIEQRRQVYGNPEETFPQIAQVFSGILGTEVRADQVPLLMIGMKLVRTSQTPAYSDNRDDIEGYLDIFRAVMGDDLVYARTVDDYVAELARRQQVQQQLLVQEVSDILDPNRGASAPIVTVDDERILWHSKPLGEVLHRMLPSTVQPGDFVTPDGVRVAVVKEVSELFVNLSPKPGMGVVSDLLLPKDAQVRFYTSDQVRATAAGELR